MHKNDLIKQVATATEYTSKNVEDVLNALLEAITQSLGKGEEVRLIGFGTFLAHKRPARTGRNLRTGAPMQIPAATVPKFVPGAKLIEVTKAAK